MSAAEPPRGANPAPSGASAAREADAAPRGRIAECEARRTSNRPQARGDHASPAGTSVASAGGPPPLLAIERLALSYGGIQAVKGIDIVVGDGELVCLIGANGAGKTTTLKGVCGLLPVKSGTIRYAGEDITGRPPYTLVRRGLSLVPEGRGMFGALTIDENLAMGAYARRDREAVRSDAERVFALFPRLRERRRQTAGTLSGGEQQMLAIARAMMSRPRLLLLDEPSMGLAPLMVKKVFETILAVAAEGVTILLVEQNARLALDVSARGYVMESGEVTLAGKAADLLHDPKVRAAYLGEAS